MKSTSFSNLSAFGLSAALSRSRSLFLLKVSSREFFVLGKLLQVHAKGNRVGIGIVRGQPIQATTKPDDDKSLQGQGVDVADVEGKRLNPL